MDFSEHLLLYVISSNNYLSRYTWTKNRYTKWRPHVHWSCTLMLSLALLKDERYNTSYCEYGWAKGLFIIRISFLLCKLQRCCSIRTHNSRFYKNSSKQHLAFSLHPSFYHWETHTTDLTHISNFIPNVPRLKSRKIYPQQTLSTPYYLTSGHHARTSISTSYRQQRHRLLH